MDGSNRNRSLSRVRRSRLVGLLGLILLLTGGLLLVIGGLWYRHQNVAARSYLDELKGKVASIPISDPISEGESTALLLPPVSEVVEISLLGSGAFPLFGSDSTTPLPSLASKTETGPGGVDQTAADQTVATSASTALSTTVTTRVAPSPESRTATKPPSHDPAIPVQSASVVTVKSRQEVFNFTPVDTATLATIGSLPQAIRIRIPAIDLVSAVTPLALLNHRGYWLFSLPKETVGQIPNTGNPGESSRGWYMGHESEVFKHLPEIVDLISEGKTVDVVLETEKVAYLYRVTGRPVILTATEFNSGYFHANLYSSQPEIVLTTCVPPRSWDYRLLVTARLVGQGVSPVTE